MLDFFFFSFWIRRSLYITTKNVEEEWIDVELAETSQPLLKYRKADDSIYRSCMFSCISMPFWRISEKIIFIY